MKLYYEYIYSWCLSIASTEKKTPAEKGGGFLKQTCRVHFSHTSSSKWMWVNREGLGCRTEEEKANSGETDLGWTRVQRYYSAMPSTHAIATQAERIQTSCWVHGHGRKQDFKLSIFNPLFILKWLYFKDSSSGEFIETNWMTFQAELVISAGNSAMIWTIAWLLCVYDRRGVWIVTSINSSLPTSSSPPPCLLTLCCMHGPCVWWESQVLRLTPKLWDMTCSSSPPTPALMSSPATVTVSLHYGAFPCSAEVMKLESAFTTLFDDPFSQQVFLHELQVPRFSTLQPGFLEAFRTNMVSLVDFPVFFSPKVFSIQIKIKDRT